MTVRSTYPPDMIAGEEGVWDGECRGREGVGKAEKKRVGGGEGGVGVNYKVRRVRSGKIKTIP